MSGRWLEQSLAGHILSGGKPPRFLSAFSGTGSAGLVTPRVDSATPLHGLQLQGREESLLQVELTPIRWDLAELV